MAILKTKVSYGGKIIKKWFFIQFIWTLLWIKLYVVATDGHFAIFHRMKSYRFSRPETCFLYVKIHFRAIGKIKTLYFMIGEDNHKKRGDRLSAMTSSSTTLNFISLWRQWRHWCLITFSLIHNVRNHHGNILCKFQVNNTNIVFFTIFFLSRGRSPFKNIIFH